MCSPYQAMVFCLDPDSLGLSTARRTFGMSHPLPARPFCGHAQGMADRLPVTIPDAHGSKGSEGYGFALTEPEVHRLRNIIRRDCGVELTVEQAWARGIELLAFAKLMAESLPPRPHTPK